MNIFDAHLISHLNNYQVTTSDCKMKISNLSGCEFHVSVIGLLVSEIWEPTGGEDQGASSLGQ